MVVRCQYIIDMNVSEGRAIRENSEDMHVRNGDVLGYLTS